MEKRVQPPIKIASVNLALLYSYVKATRQFYLMSVGVGVKTRMIISNTSCLLLQITYGI